jgi:hypothetical protein
MREGEEMTQLGKALEQFKKGKADAATVAALVKPGGKKPMTGTTLLRADAEDPDTTIKPDTFDEVSLAYMKGDLSDEQYSELVKALPKTGS